MNKEKLTKKEKLENAKRIIEELEKELEKYTKAHIELNLCFNYLGGISERYTSEIAKSYIDLLITHFKPILYNYDKYFYVSIYNKESVDFDEKIIKFYLKQDLKSVELLLTHLKVIKNIEPNNISYTEEIIKIIEETYNKWKKELKDDLEIIFK